MSSLLSHVGLAAVCPHGGQMSVITTNNRVFVNKQSVATQSDTFTIAGCAFGIPSSGPHPCLTAKWLVPAARVFVNKKPAILKNSLGVCQAADQAPQGPPTVITTQIRVKGM